MFLPTDPFTVGHLPPNPGLPACYHSILHHDAGTHLPLPSCGGEGERPGGHDLPSLRRIKILLSSVTMATCCWRCLRSCPMASWPSLPATPTWRTLWRRGMSRASWRTSRGTSLSSSRPQTQQRPAWLWRTTRSPPFCRCSDHVRSALRLHTEPDPEGSSGVPAGPVSD